MKANSSSMTRALNVGAKINTCDNSGAKVVQIISVKGHKTRKNRLSSASVGDLVMVTVIKGNPDVRKKVMPAIIVRQRKEFKRADGTRVKFEDNAIVVCKDDKGNPKGTILKGPVAKEAAERWPAVAKIASTII